MGCCNSQNSSVYRNNARKVNLLQGWYQRGELYFGQRGENDEYFNNFNLETL